MEDIKKMLVAIANGQSVLKQELVNKIDMLDKKLSGRIDSLELKMDSGFREVNARLDKQGKFLAYLEDDTPTNKDFDEPKDRFTKVERKLSVN